MNEVHLKGKIIFDAPFICVFKIFKVVRILCALFLRITQSYKPLQKLLQFVSFLK